MSELISPSTENLPEKLAEAISEKLDRVMKEIVELTNRLRNIAEEMDKPNLTAAEYQDLVHEYKTFKAELDEKWSEATELQAKWLEEMEEKMEQPARELH